MKATNRIRYIVLFLLFFISSIGYAQDTSVEMADTMRANGKIYVVVGVLSIIFTGIIVFLVIIERRLRKLEKGQN
ncbi:MAG: CcmD family protein [Bacteroidia bacterium]|nr:CcmD family protein [Bacteroidia bacterium]